MTDTSVRGHLNRARHRAYQLKVESARMSDELLAPEALRVCMEMAADIEAATERAEALWTAAQQIPTSPSDGRFPRRARALIRKVQTEL